MMGYLYSFLLCSYILLMADCGTPTKSSKFSYPYKRTRFMRSESSLAEPSSEMFYRVAAEKILLYKKCKGVNKYVRLHVRYDSTLQKITTVRDYSKSIRGSSFCDGILGVFNVDGLYYLGIIVRSAEMKGLLHAVYKATKVKLIRVPGMDDSFVDVDMDEHEESLNKLHLVLASHSLYFSKSNYDVTKTIQSNALSSHNTLSWRRCDTRFLWNLNAIRSFEQACQTQQSHYDSQSRNETVKEISATSDVNEWMDEWVIPVTNAWISTTEISLEGQQYGLSLISRRSRFNQGVRMVKRGIDREGQVSNFVETEQILWDRAAATGRMFSFVQIRGSVPLYWAQQQVWLPSPPIQLTTDSIARHARALALHLEDLQMRYVSSQGVPSRREFVDDGSGVFLVNLIDKHKTQGELGRCLVDSLDTLQDDTERLQSKRDGNSYIRLCNSSKLHYDDLGDKDQLCSDRGEVTVKDYHLLLSRTGEAAQTLSLLRKKPPLHVRHIWFDFHAKTGGLLAAPSPGAHEGSYTWREVLLYLDSAMYKEEADGSQPIGFYMNWTTGCSRLVGGHGKESTSGSREILQSTIIRTNCVDSLDRTNVLQTAIGRAVLIAQLRLLGHSIPVTVDSGEDVDGGCGRPKGPADENYHLYDMSSVALPESLEREIRLLWSRMGDGISMLYAGSRALKKDMERFGRVTARGKVRDAVNGVRRYLSNNFHDATKQQGIDLLLGLDREEMENNIVDESPLWSSPGDEAQMDEDSIILAVGGNALSSTECLIPSECSGDYARENPTLDCVTIDTAVMPAYSVPGYAKASSVPSESIGNVRTALEEIECLLQDRNSRIAAAWKIQMHRSAGAGGDYCNDNSQGLVSVNRKSTPQLKEKIAPGAGTLRKRGGVRKNTKFVIAQVTQEERKTKVADFTSKMLSITPFHSKTTKLICYLSSVLITFIAIFKGKS